MDHDKYLRMLRAIKTPFTFGCGVPIPEAAHSALPRCRAQRTVRPRAATPRNVADIRRRLAPETMTAVEIAQTFFQRRQRPVRLTRAERKAAREVAQCQQ